MRIHLNWFFGPYRGQGSDVNSFALELTESEVLELFESNALWVLCPKQIKQFPKIENFL